MSREFHPSAAPQEGTVSFYCTACGIRLVVPTAHVGSSGPCPSCGVTITPPVFPRGPSLRSQASKTLSRRPVGGRIRGDDGIDYAEQESREVLRTLKILGLFLLTLCACFVIVWLLSRHAG
jgi:predicted RNA-binding Zn-ribbon protein involved in translation (DUF1610 family)